ncbi:serine/threonine protein kinase [Enhygromyxa salina]|uniref:Serine/threonine protein kinase n=1 Tax=Enhygromyxa salina TaxID=215803 RepID=A0A0C1ZTC8_9BACT|nr:serine/threonine protein kinase [Enhygromyxa salina]
MYEPGRHGDDVFFVMEYVNGVNAHHFAQQDPAPSWEQLVDVYRGAGRGLAAAHDAGIVHGDFKPSNVLLDEHRWPRVADFGLAQVMIDNAPDDEQEQLRHRAGTLPYMAPEVLRGQAGDTRADQWSFCVSLWESLDDALPFIGWSTAELLDDIERDQPVAMNPDVPEAVRAVLRIGLAQDPDDRYPSMYALVEALDRLRQPSGVDTPSSPRRGVFLGAMVLACGLGLGGGILVSGVPNQVVEAGGAVIQASTASVEPIGTSLESNEVLERDGETLAEISDNNDARATVEQVIAYIELGRIREASAAWEQEFDIREVRDEPRANDAHRIAEAFLASAIALKNQGNINWRFAAWESTRWAARIGTLLRQEQGTKGRDPEDHALWRADADRINEAAQALLTSED